MLPYRGWLIGHFVNPSSFPLRQTDNVEVKWGVHRAGETRPAWVRGEFRTHVVILVSGRFRLDFSEDPSDHVLLAQQGDYVISGPGVDHRWTAIDDSIIVVVRWPSARPDQSVVAPIADDSST